MKMEIFTIYDKKALYHYPPFFAKTQSEAIRMINDALQDPNTVLSKYPEDFSLYAIGSYDDSTGKLSRAEHNICLLASLIIEVSNDDNPQSL